MARTLKVPTIRTENRWYQEHRHKWNLIDDLKGGTWSMRLAGKKWLPKEEAESEKAWKNRLARTYLFNAYNDTVTKLISKPFAKPVTVTGSNLPEEIARIALDVDRTGRDLTAFGASAFESAIDHGVTHILVDYPKMDPAMTLADKKKDDIRPTFVHVPATNLINWRFEGVGANAVLTRIQIRECVTRSTDSNVYAEEEVEQIREYTPTTWRVVEIGGNGDEKEIDSGVNTLGYIPLVSIYTRQTGFLTGEPALEDLAWLNLWHWQSSSDQNNVLSFSRFGMLAFYGVSAEQQENGLEVGPRRVLLFTNEKSTGEVLEGTGAAIQAGERDLRSTEQRMETLGMQPFVQREGVETATGKAIQESKTTTAIQRWIENLETGLRQAYEIAADWEGEELPDDFDVTIFSDFQVGTRGAEDAKLLLESVAAGALDNETYLYELRRRNVLAEDTDLKKVMDRVAMQAPPTPAIDPKDDSQDSPDAPEA